MASDSSISHLYADSPPTICQLAIAPHFSSLSAKEKLYAHHISRAAFLGSRITLRQVSAESEGIYDLIIELYKAVSGDWAKLGKDTEVPEKDVTLWLEYAAAVLANLGNYKSFGDQKFIPRISKDNLTKLAAISEKARSLFEKVAAPMFSTEPAAMTLLGYPEAGHVSTYYPDSPSITKAEIDAVQAFMESNNILPENTRLQKKSDKEFVLLKASASTSAPKDEKTSFTLPDGKKISVVYGDHTKELDAIAKSCKAAADASANDNQSKMFSAYEKTFAEGSVEEHKVSQKFWVKDIGPRVECNLGFIESYRDPQGVRAEWEGFVAVVNDDRTRAFGDMVAKAPTFIKRLPWGEDFEKEKFLSPDFTSLEVLTFAGSGIPIGINIPNYDDIRQTFGFKNVSLGNVMAAKVPNMPITFLKDEDKALYDSLRSEALEVQVAAHELLGHGTGKLLQETEEGKYNFDKENPPVSPITGEKIKTWYKLGQTWGSVFGSIAASYEECRAEAVAMFLAAEVDLLKIFNLEGQKAEDALYVSYLEMARAGLLALEFWDPKSRKWGQAHMQARFSLLRTFLSATDSTGAFCQLVSSSSTYDDLVIYLDRTKIRSAGVPAVGEYLKKLNVYKATADVEAGSKLYAEMTEVTEDMAKYREVVMRKKLPRKQFVMANTKLKGEEVELVEYEPTVDGMIRSFAEREV